MRRVIGFSSLFIVIILFAVLIKFALAWQLFMSAPLIPEEQDFYYFLKPGTGIKTLAHALKERNYLSHPNYLILLARLRGDSSQIKAGEYLFRSGTTPWQLLDKVTTGDVIIHHFTIGEGWTYQQIESALSKAPMLKITLQGKSPAEIMQTLKIPKNSPEGLFFPDTYHYIMGDTDAKILKSAYKLMQEKLNQLWALRSPKVPYQTPYQALVVASMIEKETALDEEKPLIASVIVNRLKKNMLLQIDPTVIYVLGNQFNGRVSFNNLQVNSPYNTYKHKGLPPSPISVPSESSLLAALQPAKTKALYYVAKGDGSHQFSANFSEHSKAILDYKIHRDIKTAEELEKTPLQDISCHEPTYMTLRKLRPLLVENIDVSCWYVPSALHFLCSSQPCK